MEGIYGLALLSASVLVLCFAAKYRNGPSAPGWFKSGVVLHTVLFTTVAGVIFAASMLIQYAFDIKNEAFGMAEVGLLVAIGAITWFCWQAIQKMPGAPRAVIGGVDDLPPPANTDGPALQSGRKGARKAA